MHPDQTPTVIVSKESDDYTYTLDVLGATPIRHLTEAQLRATIDGMRAFVGSVNPVKYGGMTLLAGLAIVVDGKVNRELARFLLG